MTGDDTKPAAPTRQIEPAFEIVLICTANRFRSPVAAEFLRKHGAELPLKLRSLGTREMGPAPPLAEAFSVGTMYGLDLTRHRARSLAGEDLAGADLVLGFERRHVATAVVDSGAARGRAFTFPELIELLPLIPKPARLGTTAAAREIVARAGELRSQRDDWLNPPELRDPVRGPPKGYVEAAARIEELCVGLLVGLFGRSETASGERASGQTAATGPPSAGP